MTSKLHGANKRVTAAEWRRRIDKLPPTWRYWVANIVWWDYFGKLSTGVPQVFAAWVDTPTPKAGRYLADDKMEQGLIRIGYPVRLAKQRARTPQCLAAANGKVNRGLDGSLIL